MADKKLNVDSFLLLLSDCLKEPGWKVHLVDKKILLTREESDLIFSPLTAVYWFITKKHVSHEPLFLDKMPDLNMGMWDILLITNATLGRVGYDRALRNWLLMLVDLPVHN